MLHQLRRELGARLDDMLAEADKLRHALTAAESRSRTHLAATRQPNSPARSRLPPAAAPAPGDPPPRRRRSPRPRPPRCPALIRCQHYPRRDQERGTGRARWRRDADRRADCRRHRPGPPHRQHHSLAVGQGRGDHQSRPRIQRIHDKPNGTSSTAPTPTRQRIISRSSGSPDWTAGGRSRMKRLVAARQR